MTVSPTLIVALRQGMGMGPVGSRSLQKLCRPLLCSGSGVIFSSSRALPNNYCGCSSTSSGSFRHFATKPKATSIAERGDEGAVTLSMREKVKENAKTGGYGLVVVAGLAVTGGLLYMVLSELFSSDSPNNIYTHAFKLCKLSPEVQDAVGTPIKCYGEETRRGWRRHVSHVEFIQGNIKYLRMKFYIEGPFSKATVNVEKKKTEGSKYEYSYVLVDVDYPPRRINVRF